MTRIDSGNGSHVWGALVTGGAGFIGSLIAERLQGLGWRVEVLDNLSTGERANVPPGVTLHIGDIRSDADVRAAMRGASFDAIVHCAAQTSVERSMKEPELDREVNVEGTRRLVMAARASGAPRFVFISSGGAVYGETAAPAHERTPPAPRSHYGVHKLAAEELLRGQGLPYAILRPSNVYGPRQRTDAEGGVVAIFLERLLAGRALEIHGSGLQTRDFVHTSDVVSAVLAALSVQRDVVWNVASGEETTVIGLAEAMARELGRTLEVQHFPRRAGDVDRSVLSPATLLATGLWGPPLPLSEGLRLTLAESAQIVA